MLKLLQSIYTLDDIYYFPIEFLTLFYQSIFKDDETTEVNNSNIPAKFKFTPNIKN